MQEDRRGMLTETGSESGDFRVKHSESLNELITRRLVDRTTTREKKHDVRILVGTTPRNIEEVFEVAI